MASRDPKSPILIAGPTASGKSALGLALAERLGGVVINADSMQIYRDVPILSAQPSAEEQARAPHRLYGHVSSHEAYSVARYAADARSEIAAAQAQGLVPIIVGGTGLYFKVLLEGLSPIPDIPEEVRGHWRAEAQRVTAEVLYAALKARDPATAARLNPSDRQRVTRALEVFEATGRPLVDWQREAGTPVVGQADCRRLVLVAEREALAARCDLRFDQMMAGGALDEARGFQTLGVPDDRPAWSTLGLRQLAAHIEGRTGLDEAIALSKTATRQYVKRQQTWLKRHMMSWNDVQMEYSERKIEKILSIVDVTLKLL